MSVKILTDEGTITRTEPTMLYNTITHNSECHTFDDVTFGLTRIVEMGLRDAEQEW